MTSALDFDGNPAPALRNRFMPRLALRRRSSDHPMVMFALVAGFAVAAMTVLPALGQSIAPVAEATQPTVSRDLAAEAPAHVAADPCAGQAWGTEDDACLIGLARDAGRTVQKVRRLPVTAALEQAPTVF
jgi:hypothetical protein